MVRSKAIRPKRPPERERSSAIREYQAQQALLKNRPVPDNTAISNGLRVVKWGALAVILILALIVMFGSPDMTIYERNVSVFQSWGFALTIVYFASAYALLQRTKMLNRTPA